MPDSMIISSYKQSLDSKRSIDHPDGFCSGVSIYWLLTQVYNEIHETQMQFWIEKNNPSEGENKHQIKSEIVDMISSAQTSTNKSWKRFGESSGPTGHDNYTPTLCRQGLLKKPITPLTTGKIENLATQLQKMHYSNLDVEFRILYVSGEESAHAMASVLKGNIIRFMDPNAGEILFFNTRDFVKWFPNYRSEYLLPFDKFVLYRYYLETVKKSAKKKKKAKEKIKISYPNLM